MLYYTGATQHLAIQTDPTKSLGGYVSSSQIPNGLINNLFYNIDATTVSKNLKQIRVIAFLNTTGSIISSFKVFTNTPNDSFSRFKIGIIKNSIDSSCNIPYFESIPNENSIPQYVQLN